MPPGPRHGGRNDGGREEARAGSKTLGLRDPRPLRQEGRFYKLPRTSMPRGDAAQALAGDTGEAIARHSRKCSWDDGVQLGAERLVTWGWPGDKSDGG